MANISYSTTHKTSGVHTAVETKKSRTFQTFKDDNCDFQGSKLMA